MNIKESLKLMYNINIDEKQCEQLESVIKDMERIGICGAQESIFKALSGYKHNNIEKIIRGGKRNE